MFAYRSLERCPRIHASWEEAEECFKTEKADNEIVITAFRSVVDMVIFGHMRDIPEKEVRKMVRLIYARYKNVCIILSEGPMGLMSECIASLNDEFKRVTIDIVEVLARGVAYIKHAMRDHYHVQAVFMYRFIADVVRYRLCIDMERIKNE